LTKTVLKCLILFNNNCKDYNMPFTEAELVAQIDPARTGRTIVLEAFMPGPTITTVYAIGVIAPYAGRSRFVDLTSSNTPAQAATQLQNELRAS
jgi:hypothetical protein